MKALSKLCSCSQFCSKFSVFFLVVLNTAIGFGGVALVALSAFVFSNFNEFDDIVSQEVIIYSICVGISLVLLSLVAIFGALNTMKKLLVFYVFLLLLIIVGEVIVVVVGLEYIGVIEKTSDAQDDGSRSLNSREAIINDFLLRSYQTCCVLNDEVCSNVQTNTNFCFPVQVCSNEAVGDEEVCILNSDSVFPVDESVCTGLERIKSELITNVTAGGCGGGQPDEFLASVIEVIHEELFLIGVFVAGLVFVEFLLVLFAMFIILGKKVDYHHKGDDSTSVLLAEPVSEQELRRMSARSSRPISFGRPGSGGNSQMSLEQARNRRQSATFGDQTTTNSRTSIERVSARQVSTPQRTRMSNERLSNGRRSSNQRRSVSAARKSIEKTGGNTSIDEGQIRQASNSALASAQRVRKPKNVRSSIPRDAIVNNPDTINDVI